MRIILTAILLALNEVPRGVLACSDEPAPMIGLDSRPHSDDGFFNGAPGIVLPPFDPVYLVGAYKMFSSAGLSPDETVALKGYNLSKQEWTRNYSYGISDSWDSAKYRLLSSDPRHEYVEKPDYGSYLNCSAETFDSAAALLEQRVSEYGADSPTVKDWVDAQETVFKNCLHTDKTAQVYLPEPLKSDSSPLKKDRAYQTAAAYFYAEDYKEARKRFMEIGGDSRSPYAKLARYLVLRSYVREAFRLEAYSEPQNELFRTAENAALKIISDPAMSGMHAPAERLLNLVRYRIAPEKELARLGAFFSGKWNAAQYDWNTNMRDYSSLLDSHLSDYKPADDMTDWIKCFSGAGAAEHAVRKWRSGGDSWLLPALSSMDLSGTSAQQKTLAEELLAAAAKIPDSAPAYDSLTYQRINRLSELGRNKEALALIDVLLQKPLDETSRMHVFAQKKRFASSLAEYLQLSLASQARRADEEWEPDYHSQDVLNTITPLRVFKDIVAYKALPSSARRAIFFPAWTQALTIGRNDAALELARTFRSQQIDSELNQALDKYIEAKSEAERSFRAAAIILENPGLRPYLHDPSPIENYGGCYNSEAYWADLSYSTDTANYAVNSEAGRMLSQQDIAEAARENAALSASEAPLLLFGRTILGYAAANPPGKETADALYAIVTNGPRAAGKAAAYSDIIKKSELLLNSKYRKELEAIKAAEKEAYESPGDEGGGN